MLPWLALLGRVMLQCGAGLHDLYRSFQQTQEAKPTTSSSSSSRGGAKARPAGSYWLLLGCARSDADQEAESYRQQVGFELWDHLWWGCLVVVRCVETAAQCLLGEEPAAAASVRQQLATLGYDMQPLLPLWDTFKRDPQVTDHLGGFTWHVSGTQGAASGHLGFNISYVLHNKTEMSSPQKLLKAVHALGAAMTAFAHPHCCNNPACGTVLGPSDAALVGGRSCMCAGCLAARYCSNEKLHWKQQHKPVCKALAAAAAGAPPGSS